MVDMIQLVSICWAGPDQLGPQMEGKGRTFEGTLLGSIMWKLWLSSGLRTDFSITSDRFRVRHDPKEPRNMRESFSLNRFSIRDREREGSELRVMRKRVYFVF
ncbi:hypothetical protein TorRG33x02_316020 [Trema orientale]|uniref:Uncharacterized protein n=1 Tax=Trema orientale TaxID=63057 RepID=A0A2P5BM33_TREOI|nr:hypothetical protein TorRG33x02_316020 [Trema orientale]